MNARERALILLLRLTGGLLVVAFFAIFLPTEWMATTHRWLGLGEFPRVPLVDYLTRSASALYCIHGGLMLVLSRDVRRFAPVVVYVAMAGIGFGVGHDRHRSRRRHAALLDHRRRPDRSCSSGCSPSGSLAASNAPGPVLLTTGVLFSSAENGTRALYSVMPARSSRKA